MQADENICAACGAHGRLHCADCDRTFCVEHVERHFAMGYFYLCAACTAQRLAQELPPPKPKRKRAPRA